MPEVHAHTHNPLVQEGRDAQKYAFEHGDTGYALILRALTDAIEAATIQLDGCIDAGKIARMNPVVYGVRPVITPGMVMETAVHREDKMKGVG